MSIKLKDTIYDLINKAEKDGSGNTITSTYLKLSGGTMTGPLTMGQYDLNFKGSDPGDIVWQDADGKEIHRIWDNGGVLSYRKDAGTAYTILHSGNSSVSKSGETLTVKINGSTQSLTNTNTTYSAGTGISLSGTTFSNSGVRSISTGTANGTISVNTNGTSANVSVKGLGSAAYTASSDYATSGHNHDGTYLKKVTVANNAENDFNSFEGLTLTGRGDPTTGASLKNAPWTGAGPAGGYGTLTYLWSGYGTQMAWGYHDNRIYIRNRYYYDSKANWSSTWDSIALTSDIPTIPTSLKCPKSLTIQLNGTSQGAWDGSADKTINITSSSIGAAASSHTHTKSQITDFSHTHNYAGSSSAGGAATSALTSAQLTTARTIWGQSFNGTGNVDGTLTINHNSQASGTFAFIINRNNDGDTVSIKNTSSAVSTYIRGSASFPNRTKTNGMGWHVFPAESQYTNGLGNTGSSYNINGCSITFGGWNDTSLSMYIDTEGKKVGIKTVNPAFPLHVNGAICTNSYIRMTASGTGTYNVGDISFNSTTGLQIEAPLKSDSSSGDRYPITLSWRGGISNKGGLQITGSSTATLGGNTILHAGNWSSYCAASGHTHNYAGSDTPGGGANSVRNTGFGNGNFTWYQSSSSFFGSNWSSGWASYLISNHGDGKTYYNVTIALPFWGVPHYKRLEGGVEKGWYTFITAENIGSQSVNYATSSGNANTVDGYHISVGSSAGSDANTIYYIV